MKLSLSTVAFVSCISHNTLTYSKPTTVHQDESYLSAPSALDATIDAMGGLKALKNIKTFTYRANTIYRSHTLTQNYNLMSSDQSVSAAGSQNMSFSLEGQYLRCRVDRSYMYDDYWTWAFPDLRPFIDFSLVIEDGPEGFACFTKGQNSFFASDPTIASGYTDPYLSDYLIHQSQQFALPGLLLKFTAEVDKLQAYRVQDSVADATYLALEHPGLALIILLDTKTHLPHAVRMREKHIIYGDSTNDVVVSSWNSVDVGDSKVLLPHRFQTVYNSEIVLEDFIIDKITINEAYPAEYFDGHRSSDNSFRPPLTREQSVPAESSEYPRSEVHEFFESGLWAGPFGQAYNVSDVVVEYPFSDYKNIMTIYVAYADYVQVLVEHDSGLLITDAAPHRSKIILDWVERHMNGKQITHVVPSHHHRDHAGGVNDYVEAGATLVIPEMAKELYNFTGKVSNMVTYTDVEPFEFKDSSIEFRSFWKDENPHARDWSFSVVTRADPSDGDGFAVFSADVINPGTPATKWGTDVARDFILQMMSAGVPRSSLIVGAHGSSHGGTSTSESLEKISEIIGMTYPPLMADDWSARGRR